jgi:CCR4-NOT transcription complex subunit 7/8
MPCPIAEWRYIAIDTEYLGTVHGMPAGAVLSPTMRNYALIKANIDELLALQLELTICNEDGNLLVVINNDGHPLQLI